jgi:predicted Zn-dependent protease
LKKKTQKDSVPKLLEQFQAKFNDKSRYGLLKMSLLYKDKKYAECEKLLGEVVDADNKPSLTRLYLIQVLLLQGKVNEAIEQFKFLDEYKTYKLGIVRF